MPRINGITANNLNVLRKHKILSLGGGNSPPPPPPPTTTASPPPPPTTTAPAGNTQYVAQFTGVAGAPNTQYVLVNNTNQGLGQYQAWCYEFWFYPTTVAAIPSGDDYYLVNPTGAQGDLGLWFGSTYFGVSNYQNWSLYDNVTINANTWYHFAVYQNYDPDTSARSTHLAINGQQLTCNYTYNPAASPPYNPTGTKDWPFMNRNYSALDGEGFGGLIGYIMDLRIVLDNSVYPNSDFTPPTSRLTAIAGTNLLLFTNSNTIADNSGRSVSVNAGSVTMVQHSVPF